MNPAPETSSCSLMHLVTKQEHFSSEQADNPPPKEGGFCEQTKPESRTPPAEPFVILVSRARRFFWFASGSGDENEFCALEKDFMNRIRTSVSEVEAE